MSWAACRWLNKSCRLEGADPVNGNSERENMTAHGLLPMFIGYLILVRIRVDSECYILQAPHMTGLWRVGGEG